VSAARNTWAKHYQSVWEERAADPAYPIWCRVAWLHTHVIRPTDTPAFSEDRFGRYSAVSVKTDSNR
jgi:hypothetical protein